MILAHYKLEPAGGINLSPNVRTAAIQRLAREDGEEIIEEHLDSGLTYVLEKRR